MLGNCPNHPKIKYLVCSKCNKTFKYENQKLVECFECFKKSGSNIESRGSGNGKFYGKCFQKVFFKKKALSDNFPQ